MQLLWESQATVNSVGSFHPTKGVRHVHCTSHRRARFDLLYRNRLRWPDCCPLPHPRTALQIFRRHALLQTVQPREAAFHKPDLKRERRFLVIPGQLANLIRTTLQRKRIRASPHSVRGLRDTCVCIWLVGIRGKSQKIQTRYSGRKPLIGDRSDSND